MKSVLTSRGSGLSQAETTTAVQDALTNVNADTLVDTRHHDMTLTGLNAAGGALVEMRVDNSTTGTGLAAAVKKIHISSTIGEPIEIRTGANSGASTRRAVLNLGDGPLFLECIITSGHGVYLRSMSSNAITEGVLTINFLG